MAKVVDRRRLLASGWAASSVLVAPALLSACANKGPAPPEPPPPPPRPIAQLALLPAALATTEESTGFGAPDQAAFVVTRPTMRSNSPSIPAAAIGLGLIGMAIAYGIQENRRQQREQLLAALVEVNFDARSTLDERIAARLAATKVRFVLITETQRAADVEGGDAAALPSEVDAALKVTVVDQGYYASLRAGGYSPMLHVDTMLHSTGTPREELEGFTYYADWRDGGGDPRWITTPKSATFKTIDELRAGAAAARAGLLELVDQFAIKIVDDVQRYVAAGAAAG